MKISVRVQTNSGRQEIKKISDTEYKVFLKKSAVDGKANEELQKFLKKEFKKNIKIIKGQTSRDKVIEVE